MTIEAQESDKEDEYGEAYLVFQIEQYQLKTQILATIESAAENEDD